MKPGDHPDFFRSPPPPGRSRESTIVLDRTGRFFHEGELVAHRGLAEGFASWISVHPDDGRYILTNGYDWCYFQVEDTPYFVVAVASEGDEVMVELFDGAREALDARTLAVHEDDVLRCRVKGGRFPARFTRQAQLMLAPLLAEDGLAIVVGNERHPIARVTSP